MSLSFREKSLWGSVAAMVVVYGYYFTGVITRGTGQTFNGESVGRLMSPVILVIVINIVYNIAIAIKWRPEPKDERDRLIEGKSYFIAYQVMVVGALVSMWGAAILVVVRGSMPAATPLSPMFVTGNLIFFFLVAAEVAKSLTQLFYYRRGV